MEALPESTVLDSIPSVQAIRLRLQAIRQESEALQKLLKIAVRRDVARELRSRSVPA